MPGINSFDSTTNRLTSATYDDAGNMTVNPVGAQHAYDAENRLNQITFEEGAETNFSYDDNGLFFVGRTATTNFTDAHTYGRSL